ncbi:hypothetical protein V2J09_022076 [Rumex salicifolius]
MERPNLLKKSIEVEEQKEGSTPKRIPLKTLNTHKLDKNNNQINWKQKLKESCYRRVREDRSRLLWKMRSSSDQDSTEKEFVKSAFQNIVSDEMRKIKDSSSNEDIPTVADDMLWEYDGLHTAYQGDCEDILLEMQRIFYEDLKTDPRGRETENSEAWEDEEDEFLARSVFEYMQLNDEKARKEKIWCPICKKGEVKENSSLIYCNCCQFQLKRGDEINLALLRTRLAESHDEHFDRGCRSKPEFCIETTFDFTALYIQCQNCHTFEVII